MYPYRQQFPSAKSGTSIANDPEFFVKKPLGHSWFEKEIVAAPQSWAERTGNLVFYRQHEKGGHFAALERPEVLKKDLEDFVEQVWKK